MSDEFGAMPSTSVGVVRRFCKGVFAGGCEVFRFPLEIPVSLRFVRCVETFQMSGAVVRGSAFGTLSLGLVAGRLRALRVSSVG